jgi:hypothetical protein
LVLKRKNYIIFYRIRKNKISSSFPPTVFLSNKMSSKQEKVLEGLLKKRILENDYISDQASEQIEQLFEKNKESFFISILKLLKSKDKNVIINL